MTRLVAGGLLLVLVVGCGAWLFMPGLPSAGRIVGSTGADDLSLSDAEEAVVLEAYRSRIDLFLRQREKTNLTDDWAHDLQMSRQFLQRFVQRHSADHNPSALSNLAARHRELGVVNFLLRDFVPSEFHFRESLRLSNAALTESNQPDLQVLRAMSEGNLGWVLAMTGRLVEAQELMTSAVSHWNGLPDAPIYMAPLAICQRNLAMICQVGGADGTEHAMASVTSASRALKASAPSYTVVVGHDASVNFFDTLIDSEQYLAMQHWQRGRWAEAQHCCRSSINRLQEMLMAIESTYDQSRYVATNARSERYRAALDSVHQNLMLLSRMSEQNPDAAGIEALSSGRGDWQWELLHTLPGQSLPMDFVIRGNRFPGEFESQDALLLSWQYEWANEAMASIIQAVHVNLPVILLVDDALQQQQAEDHLEGLGVSLDRIQFQQVATDSLWVRDFGPLSVQSTSGVPLWIDPVYPLTIGMTRFEDDELPQELARSQQVTTATLPYLIEGGGIISNGAGICLVTTYLKDRNAELGVGEAQLTGAIRQYLGAEQVVYLEPLIDEPTHHLDWFCAFTSPETIVVGEYGNDDPANRELLDRHARRLDQLETPGGKLKVVRIPMPPRSH